MEILLVALTILFLFLKPYMPQFGERISMIFFGTLSFYYLASGVLVFLDKYRVSRMMRLIYMSGLWAVSILVIGIMARTLLIQKNTELITISISSAAGILLFGWLQMNRLEDAEKRKLFRQQLQPLLLRGIISIVVGLGFLFLSAYSVYYMFGTYRKDPTYTDKAVNAYLHPDDSLIVNDFKTYDAMLRNTDDSTAIKK